MLVRMLVGLSGTAYLLQSGDERDFPNDEALRLIDAGYAVPVSDPEIEHAVVVPVTETRGRKKRNVVSGKDYRSRGK
jgi:hypothetical protein